ARAAPRPRDGAASAGGAAGRADGAVDLSEITASTAWTRLRDLLREATGEEFTLAQPRQEASAAEDDADSFLRVEIEDGRAMVPAASWSRLEDLPTDVCLQVVVSTARLLCIEIVI